MINIEDVFHCLSHITGILSHQRSLDDGSPETEYLSDSMKGNEDVQFYLHTYRNFHVLLNRLDYQSHDGRMPKQG